MYVFNLSRITLGVVHKGRPQQMTGCFTPYLCPHVSAFDQFPSPLRTPAFNIIHCAMVWHRVVLLIFDIPHLTRIPGGLICVHLTLRARGA